MLSLSMIARLWRTARYRQLLRQLLEGRAEAGLGLEDRIGGPLSAAAAALLRFGELSHRACPLAAELRQRLILAQCSDGSWGQASSEKAMLTALCIRGLVSAGGIDEALAPFQPRLGMAGEALDRPRSDPCVRNAVERGIHYLARVQRPAGGWGEQGSQGLVTGFVLLQLGRIRSFQRAVRAGDALRVGQAADARDTAIGLLWSHVRQRCGRALVLATEAGPLPRITRAAGPIFAEVA